MSHQARKSVGGTLTLTDGFVRGAAAVGQEGATSACWPGAEMGGRADTLRTHRARYVRNGLRARRLNTQLRSIGKERGTTALAFGAHVQAVILSTLDRGNI